MELVTPKRACVLQLWINTARNKTKFLFGALPRGWARHHHSCPSEIMAFVCEAAKFYQLLLRRHAWILLVASCKTLSRPLVQLEFLGKDGGMGICTSSVRSFCDEVRHHGHAGLFVRERPSHHPFDKFWRIKTKGFDINDYLTDIITYRFLDMPKEIKKTQKVNTCNEIRWRLKVKISKARWRV